MDIRIKTAISALLSRTGMLGIAGRLSSQDRRLALTLHRVLPEEEISTCHNPHLVLSQRSFEAFLAWLLRNFSLVPLAELLESPDPGSRAKRLCALTFDDGWEDNFRVAYPILQKYSVPATVFLATGYIGSVQRMPEERFARVWQRAEREDGIVELYRDLAGMLFPTADSATPELAHCQQRLKSFSHVEKISVLARLETKYGVETPSQSLFMTWEQIRTMSRDGISFESHTVHHKLLACENDSDVRKELMESRNAIEREIGCDSRIFAYPSGSVDDRVAGIVQQAGYRAALTTLPGAIRSGSNSYYLPRVAIADDVLNGSDGKFSQDRAQFHLTRHLCS